MGPGSDALKLVGKTILVTLGVGGVLVGALQLLLAARGEESAVALGVGLLAFGLLASGVPIGLAVRDAVRAGRQP